MKYMHLWNDCMTIHNISALRVNDNVVFAPLQFVYFPKGEAIMQTMTRQEAVEQLLERYGGYYDVWQAEEGDVPFLAAGCDFHAHSEKYILTKKAKLWQAESHEYVFLFSVPQLTEDIYRACEAAAYERGMEKVKPGPEHMYTYITAVFVCDSCTPEARKALRRCRIYKSFRLSYWGWMDFHTALVQLDTGRVNGNFSGRSAAQLLETTLFHKRKKLTLRKERTL